MYYSAKYNKIARPEIIQLICRLWNIGRYINTIDKMKCAQPCYKPDTVEGTRTNSTSQSQHWNGDKRTYRFHCTVKCFSCAQYKHQESSAFQETKSNYNKKFTNGQLGWEILINGYAEFSSTENILYLYQSSI